MKRKILCMVVALSFMMSILLTGCGSEGKPANQTSGQQKTVANTASVTSTEGTLKAKDQKPVTLKMTMWSSELDEKTYNERAALVKEQYPNITIQVQNIPENYDQKLQTMLSTGQGPDILLASESMNTYSAEEAILPLDEYVKNAGINLDETYGTAYKAYMYKGKLYGIPDRSGAMVLYYNKDMFDKAKVKYPTKAWTWNDFLDAAKKTTITENGKITQYGYASGTWWPWFMSFLYQNGGRVLDDNYENVIINSPQSIEALNFFGDLVQKYHVAPDAKGYQAFGLANGKPDQLFAQGKCAMEMTGFWNVGSLKKIANLNWDMAPLFKQKVNATFTFGTGMAINKTCKDVDSAFKAIIAMTSEKGEIPIVKNNQDAPANIKVLSSDLFLKPEGLADKNFKAFADSADMIFSPPLHPSWSEISKVFDTELSSYLEKGGDSTATIQKMEKDLKTILAK